MATIYRALTIAGTDPTGGAGIQADLKTFQEREVYGMSVVTSLVAQNTTGVQDIHHLPLDFIEAQFQSVITDIYPNAVKTGMIATPEMMSLLKEKISDLSHTHYVCDPVMMAKNGDALLSEEVRAHLRHTLVPLASIVTPNIAEAEDLVEMTIDTRKDMQQAATRIVKELGAHSAVVKGGSLAGEAVDVFVDQAGAVLELDVPRTETRNNHGTGCTFSAAICAELAKGSELSDAVQTAKIFISDAIAYQLNLGHGHGPTNHWGHRLQGLPHPQTNEE
ncbi:bifunctional hydroxymethylpyrimidine kinase/phosphomethylpyrimidine kinase [Shouchella shacheensis]|uniref:bifunctional hydroxymethylpyrimidine kinase/phosphomethylpyrimidine kinase n=1 Tax=Shouchella shacheensis TaxID=1649580 RepID=UPI00073FE29A|nr:bifunctional hydroxymethylpyrimidine kinase/phosphomethylpyrimidine kinase [Shouchella shacheensis]